MIALQWFGRARDGDDYVDLLDNSIGDAKTNVATVKFLSSKKIKQLRSRAVIHEIFMQGVNAMLEVIKRNGSIEYTDIYVESVIPGSNRRSYANITAGLTLLLLQGKVLAKRNGHKIHIYDVDAYPNKDEITFYCKNILTFQQMVRK